MLPPLHASGAWLRRGKKVWICGEKFVNLRAKTMDTPKVYIAIDLKSFYASVECVERGLDPLTARLVVADASRTSKTICLAVSPALKALGIPGRPRLFEVEQKALGVDYIVAPPRMSLYVEYSHRINAIYQHYVAPEDTHVYSVDEVFLDVTNYLKLYRTTAHDLAMRMIQHVLRETGITATAGIGTNMYLCKVAMDVVAKHIPADADGVRIAELDEMSYRRLLWNHRPLTDFWRVGRGMSRRLENIGITTMGQVARLSLVNEDLLYTLFGVNAELLIDHAWGWEPCTMPYVKAYRPETHSLSSGQVLKSPYPNDKALIVLTEMADALSLDLVRKGLVTDRIEVTVNYDAECLTNPSIASLYDGPVRQDHYGRNVPKHSHGSEPLGEHTSSSRLITEAARRAFQRVANPVLLVRRLTIVALHVQSLDSVGKDLQRPQQLDLFTDYEALARQREEKSRVLRRENSMQRAILAIKEKFGKNAILRGTSFDESATARERNEQIGGHKA